jgi:acyl-coenzyme A thioesterase PaaI-like protein
MYALRDISRPKPDEQPVMRITGVDFEDMDQEKAVVSYRVRPTIEPVFMGAT